MKNLTLDQKLRTGHLKRWHMVRVLRDQTLAEHNSLVQIIALDVADTLIRTSISYCIDVDKFRMDVMEWSLWHDMPEVVTGDISTPLKAMMASNGQKDLFGTIESSIDSAYAELSLRVSPRVKAIVKFADLYEAINFLHMEGHGHRAQAIERELIGRMVDHIQEVSKTELSMGEVFQNAFDGMFDYADK